MKLLSATAALFLCAGQAFGQFAQPVPPRGIDYGPGRIDSSFAYQHIGQTVTSCGRVAQQGTTLEMGVSPYAMIVVFPPNVGPQAIASYNFKMICVTGTVYASDASAVGVRAQIPVQAPSQIVFIPDPGPRF